MTGRSDESGTRKLMLPDKVDLSAWYYEVRKYLREIDYLISMYRFGKCVLTLIWLLMVFPWVQAQYAETDFVRYTVKEGLSHSDVYSVLQDHAGFIWVGTRYGLNRFDGHQFKAFHHELPDDFLRSSSIRELFRVDTFQMGIISHGGFQILDTRDGHVRNFVIPDTTAMTFYRNAPWDVHQMADGGFAVTTATGFYVFDAQGGITFRHDAYAMADIGNQRILYGREIYEVAPDILAVYTEEQSLSAYYHRTKTFVANATSDQSLWPFSHPGRAADDRWIFKHQFSDHEFLFAQNGDSITYYNHLTGKRVRSILPFPAEKEFAWDSRVYPINDSTYAVCGGRLGFFLFHLDKQSGKIVLDPKKHLGAFKIRNFFVDRENRLWIATTTGLMRHIQAVDQIHHYSWLPDEEGNIGFTDAFLHDHILFLGRFDRRFGLIAVDARDMSLLNRYSFYGENSKWNEVYSIAMYHPDTLWVGTHSGLLWFDIRSEGYGKVDISRWPLINHEDINVLAPLHTDGTAWMLSWLTGNVIRYDVASRKAVVYSSESDPPLPFSKVKHIVYDAYGDVWIGGHSLARWNHVTHTFDTTFSAYAGPGKYNDDIVSISADAKGSLWIYNALNTLLEYEIRPGRFKVYGPSEGMPRMSIEGLSPIYRDVLFVQGSNQIARINTVTREITVVADEHDLPAFLSVSRRMDVDSVHNRALAFYKNELITIPVDAFDAPTNLTGIMVYEIVINSTRHVQFPEQGFRLSANENNLVIHFTIIDFDEGDQYLFSYRVNEASDWTAPARQRSIDLSNMSPGKYLVELKAVGKSGAQKLTTFEFSIAPPFWTTGWFYGLVGCLVAGSGWWVYRANIARIRRKANLDQLISQTEMKALHAQMNPHFIFNSLNSIREMILTNDNANASRYLSKFAQLIRSTLDHSRQSLISLRQTVDYLCRYVEMEKIRSVQFDFVLHIDPELDPDEILLPPMIIQPFVENAIWHGKGAEQKCISISVSFNRSGDHLVSIIDDNGIGIQHAMNQKQHDHGYGAHHSVGISNIRERINVLNRKHAAQANIVIEDKGTLPDLGPGTRVTITFPLDYAAP